jgi:CRP-like cAMP-binding protein
VELDMSASPTTAQSAGDLSAILSGAAPFVSLTTPILRSISDVAFEHRLRAGATLIAAGQADGSEFYFVASGRLNISTPGVGAPSVVLEAIEAGEFYGLAAAVASITPAAIDKTTIVAAADSHVLSIEAAPFRNIVSQRPSLTRALLQYFAQTLAQRGVVAESADAPERRVFAALLTYVERDHVSGDWRVPRMPKHRELAEKAGADEAEAAAAVATLIQEGAARREYPGLIISDIAFLRRAAT